MINKKTNPSILLDDKDNVVVARIEIPAGTLIATENITTLQKVPMGHKIARRLIKKDEAVLKYNTVIGYATEDLPAGTWMHSHNIHFDEVIKDYAFARDYKPVELLPPEQRATFQGYKRANGEVGTRNYIGVFVVGNCGATVARKISEYFTEEKLAPFANVDGVIPFIHELGCGMEKSGEPMSLLRRTLAGYMRNPNIAASVVVSLGCERNNIHDFFAEMQLTETDTVKQLIIQELGGTRKSIAQGIALVEQMLPAANQVQRSTESVEHLKIGMQCGGSDGFSGLSANPALGAAMDILIKHGGTAILSETTELFGVEHTLTAKAVNKEVGQKIVDCMNWWLKYNEGKDCQINGQVSPGNNAGGLANILEKSLGGAKKGGNSPVMEVYKYAEPITTHGLVIMDTPGYDPVSATGQIAGGANMIAFTTGRGSCFGSYPAPCVKLASNTPMFERMEDDMDVNCGLVIDGEKSITEMGQIIFEKLIAIASGEESKSESLGVGLNEFVPWPLAVLA